MAIKALNPLDPVWYIPRIEVGQENPTRFRIRGLDGQAMGYVAPEFIVDEHHNIKNITGKGIDLALTYGLVDWENVANDKGDVKFNRARFGLLPYDIRSELAVEIVKLSAPSEDERKN